MIFAWPDPVSFVADIVTLIGVPVLTYSTWGLYKQFEKERQPRGVSENCVSFYDVDARCAINLVPFKQLAVIPIVGNCVYLQERRTKNAIMAVVSMKSSEWIFTTGRTRKRIRSFRQPHR